MHAATRDDEHRRAVEEEPWLQPAEVEGVDEAWAASARLSITYSRSPRTVKMCEPFVDDVGSSTP